MEMAMKKIRIEFPVFYGKGEENDAPTSIWLKVTGNHTEAFKDEALTQSFLAQTEEKVVFEIEVPENLEVIEVPTPNIYSVAELVYFDWIREMRNNVNWRIPGLKKMYFISKRDKLHEIKVVDEKPDFDDWMEYTRNEEKGMLLILEMCGLVVYMTEDRCIGKFHFRDKKRLRPAEMICLNS